MSINAYNSQTGTSTVLANGQRLWMGTQSAHDAAVQAGTMPNNCLVSITDDFPTDSHFVDTDISNSITVNTGTLSYCFLSRDNNVYNLNVSITGVSASGSSGTLVMTVDTTKVPWITQTRNVPVTVGAVNDQVGVVVMNPNGKLTLYSQGTASITGNFLLDFTYIV